MARSALHSWLAGICLICFGLANTFLGSGLVECLHADGTRVIEWWPCDPDAVDCCVTGCDGEDLGGHQDVHRQPCKDTPVEGDEQIVKVTPRVVHEAPAFAVTGIASDSCERPAVASRRVSVSISSRERPPDALFRWRTILLLV